MTKENDAVLEGTQIFTDKETLQLQKETGITSTTDSVTLISALLSRIADNSNNTKAIELYKSVMYAPRYPSAEDEI